MAVHAVESLGSDFHFVNERPLEDYYCPVCTELLTEPFLTDCCGQHLCRTCRGRLLASGKAECPMCREPNTLEDARLNKHLRRQVNDLKVRCKYHEEGCTWEGELRNLEEHLAKKRCDFMIVCSFGCGELVPRNAMQEHKVSHCRKRPFTCEHCGYHNALDIVTEKHYPICRSRPPYPADYPSKKVFTPPQAAGCPQYRYLFNVPPVELTMSNYLQWKEAGKEWISPPFYTHPRGYKMCLKVVASGCGTGKGTHTSVYTCLMKGEHDNQLQWPFEGDIVVEVRNWKKDVEQYDRPGTFVFNRLAGDTLCDRVTETDFGTSCGYSQFIPNSSLSYNPTTNTEYLQDDFLQLRVKTVVVYSTPLFLKTPAWQDPFIASRSLSEFTVTEFSKRKQFRNMHYSPPFYTHPQGYKMCLEVVPNGVGSGKGTHLSIFACLMNGEHDDQLHWPFRGDTVVELLNWKEDMGHLERTVSLELNSDMTKGGFRKSHSHTKFIPHSSLSYNPTTNTEYLQDDCLRLRVKTMALYSTPLLPKTPAWQDSLTATQSLSEFTVTEFSKRKQFNNMYYSPSFYTHPQGYKMCLRVEANSSEGTHVSVYAHLMKGEHDNQLQWPFEGNVVIELLNWRINKGHHKKTINLNGISHARFGCCARVTAKEINTGFGTLEFTPYSSLAYNPTTNTEYLQDDCLRIRVKTVSVYSTPLRLKTPAWQDSSQSLCRFTVAEFSKRKLVDNEYYSPPFYTHPQGYKMCLRVDANGNGNGKGTHVSIFAYLMKGEHDDQLQWPFEGEIVLELLNWRENRGHHEETTSFNRSSHINNRCCARVTDNEIGTSWGKPQFIPHSSLPYNRMTNTEYLQDDCLRLRVKTVAVYFTPLHPKIPAWQDSSQSLCQMTVAEFSKRKLFNNVYHGPPFYTHPQGYKMCLRVYANGDGSGKGTHVSIYAHLMKGEHDDQLQWPFEGEIVLELLNWRENRGHHKQTISFNRSFHASNGCCARVTANKLSSWGKPQFISHSSLPYKPTTNTEYLQDDCLRLRVKTVAVYFTPLHPKTPAWKDSSQSLCQITVTEFSKRKLFNHEYYSPPFYTHPQGYKMCLKVVPNGDDCGKGTHMSIYAFLMKGEHDNQLQWPFEGDVIVELLNWRKNKGHHKETMDFSMLSNMNNGCCARLTANEINTGWGLPEFIPHSSLAYKRTTNTEYLQDDCLRLRVKTVLVYSTPFRVKTPAWQDTSQSLCKFTVAEFTKRKLVDNEYYSPPFYTHRQGYKMCLKVHANGFESGKHTHVSVYAYLMKGEYDHQLQWPFRGDVTVELLNWRQNKGHHKATLHFNGLTPAKSACTRVTKRIRAEFGWGRPQFFPHQYLSYRFFANTEYLQDDCLRLRVNVIVKS